MELRTGGALVEVEKATGEADEAGQPHGLGKAALADLRRGELLHGVEQARATGSGNSAVDIVARPGVPNYTLEVPAHFN